MLLIFLALSLAISYLLIMAFSFGGKKFKWESGLSSPFECGFTPYFTSRYSFSIHYFLVALTFLFVDLEMCLLFPFFVDVFSSYNLIICIFFFTLVLTLGVVAEWSSGILNWKE